MLLNIEIDEQAIIKEMLESDGSPKPHIMSAIRGAMIQTVVAPLAAPLVEYATGLGYGKDWFREELRNYLNEKLNAALKRYSEERLSDKRVREYIDMYTRGYIGEWVREGLASALSDAKAQIIFDFADDAAERESQIAESAYQDGGRAAHEEIRSSL